ncbi:hypothetical protein ACWGHQ_21805, partial [Streptomyces griseus]
PAAHRATLTPRGARPRGAPARRHPSRRPASDPGVPYATAVPAPPGAAGVRGAPSPALMPLTADAETS